METANISGTDMNSRLETKLSIDIAGDYLSRVAVEIYSAGRHALLGTGEKGTHFDIAGVKVTASTPSPM